MSAAGHMLVLGQIEFASFRPTHPRLGAALATESQTMWSCFLRLSDRALTCFNAARTPAPRKSPPTNVMMTMTNLHFFKILRAAMLSAAKDPCSCTRLLRLSVAFDDPLHAFQTSYSKLPVSP